MAHDPPHFSLQDVAYNARGLLLAEARTWTRHGLYVAVQELLSHFSPAEDWMIEHTLALNDGEGEWPWLYWAWGSGLRVSLQWDEKKQKAQYMGDYDAEGAADHIKAFVTAVHWHMTGV